MARLLVLSFEDNDKVQTLVDLIPRDCGINVVGLFALPTQFCETPGGCGKGKLQAWTRGKKFGWWVCSKCRKPAKPLGGSLPERLWRNVALWGHNMLEAEPRKINAPVPYDIAQIPQGRNLLEDASNEPATVFDEGWGAHRNA